MKNLLYIIVLLIFLTNALYSQELVEQTLIHDGIEREYLLSIPTSYDPNGEAFPLVFSFHGFTSNANQQRNYTGMDETAENNGFIVCYPEGIGNAWNVGWNFGSTEDDIGFTEAMIEKIASDYKISRQQIYSCGMSNGGYFSYRLACELSHKIAAIASVTGSFTDNILETCSPSRKIPIMEIHGTDDLIVPYNGMEGTAIPIEDVVAFWVDHNACTMEPDTTAIPNTNASDGCTSEMIEYLICDEESEIVFIKITGGGHTWPGATINLPGTSQDYDGNQLIWDFFNRHRLPAVLTTTPVYISSLSIYPNPAKNKITIKGLTSIHRVTIYNIYGSTIKTDTKEEVDISFLPMGVYFLEAVDNSSKRYIEKFIVE